MGNKLGIKAPAIGSQFKVGDELPIARISTNGGTQARAGLNSETVAEYTQAMQDGAIFPLIVVFYDGTDHWLADGFHRVEAARRIGEEKIRADVRQGDKRAAVLWAVGANATHGLRRTTEDKRRAIETLLRDAEWQQWSDRKIADVCGVSDKTVAATRRDLSAEIPQIATRTIERAGTTYQMTPAARMGAINRPDGSSLELPAAPDFDVAQARAAALGRTLSRHGGWWQLEHAGYKQPAGPPADVIAEITRLEKPKISEPTPITVRTTDGTHETTPQRTLGGLALHPSVADARKVLITHIASGRGVAEFSNPLSAAAAFPQLAALDWSQVADGHTGPDLRRQINEIVINYNDVNRWEERKAQLREDSAPSTGEPEKEEQRTENRDDRSSAWHKEQQAIDDTALASAQICIERGNVAAARMLLNQVKVKTVARDALSAQIGDAPPPVVDPRAHIAALLRQLTPLLVALPPADDQEGLSEAIDALYHAKAGTEARGAISVIWALLDLEES